MIFEPIEVDKLVSVYAFSNTPTYLYERLRQLQFIQNITKRVSTSMLIEEFNRLASSEKGSVEDISVAYAILVALTFLEYREAVNKLSQLELSRLEWGQDIKQIFMANARITNVSGLTIHLTTDILDMARNSSTNITEIGQRGDQKGVK